MRVSCGVNALLIAAAQCRLTHERLALWLDTNELVVFADDPLEGSKKGQMSDGMDTVMATEVVSAPEDCNECHSYEEYTHGAGPSLHGVVGRKIGGKA